MSKDIKVTLTKVLTVGSESAALGEAKNFVHLPREISKNEELLLEGGELKMSYHPRGQGEIKYRVRIDTPDQVTDIPVTRDIKNHRAMNRKFSKKIIKSSGLPSALHYSISASFRHNFEKHNSVDEFVNEYRIIKKEVDPKMYRLFLEYEEQARNWVKHLARKK